MRKNGKIFISISMTILASVLGVFSYPAYSDDTIRAQPVQKAKESPAVARERTILESLNAGADLATPILIDALNDQDPSLRHAASWALGRVSIRSSQFNKVIDALLDSLKEEDPWTKVQIIETLWNIEHTKKEQDLTLDVRVRDALLKQVDDPNPYIRAEAIKGLHPWGNEPAVKKVLDKVFRDGLWVIRYASLFGMNGNPEILKKAARDETPAIRLLAVTTIARRHYDKDPEILALLIERLRDPEGSVLMESMWRLMDLRERRAIKPILDLIPLGMENQVRRVVEEISGKSLEETITQEGWVPNPNVRFDAPINRVSHGEIQNLVQTLKKGSLYERTSAVLRLTWVAEENVLEVLRGALRDSEPLVRYAALDALSFREATFRQKGGSDVILQVKNLAIRDNNSHVRRKALAVIGGNHLFQKDKTSHEDETKLIHSLIDIIDNQSEEQFVRAEAVSSLIALINEPERYNQVLVRLLEDPFYVIRQRAVSKVDLACAPEALTIVLKLLNDPVASVRVSAAQKFMFHENQKIFANNTKVLELLKEVAEHDLDKSVQNAAAQSIKQLQSNRLKDNVNITKKC